VLFAVQLPRHAGHIGTGSPNLCSGTLVPVSLTIFCAASGPWCPGAAEGFGRIQPSVPNARSDDGKTPEQRGSDMPRGGQRRVARLRLHVRDQCQEQGSGSSPVESIVARNAVDG
jgi:hypothetical protein